MQNKIFCLLFCLLTTGAFAQSHQLTGTRINHFSSITIDQSLAHYEVFRIDVNSLLKRLSGQTSPFVLDIDLDQFPKASPKIKPSMVCSDNYVTLVGEKGGAKADRSMPAVYPFIQTADNNNEETAITFAKDMIYGYYQKEGHTYYIEPLSNYDAGQARDLYLVYDKNEIKEGSETVCGGVEIEQEIAAESRDNNYSKLCGPKVVEIAIANDAMMVTKYGSVAATVAHNFALINAVKANWENDFDQALFLQVVTQFVPLDGTGDPFPSTTNRTIFLNFFRDWANGGGFGEIDFDYGHLRTPRILRTDAGVQVLGSTYSTSLGTPQVCTSYRYSVFSEFGPFVATLDQMRTVNAHEMGHLFGASHTATGSPENIMTGAFSGNPSNLWLQASKDQINLAIAGAGCLTNGTFSSICTFPTSLPQPQAFIQPFTAGLAPICTTYENPCIGGFIFYHNEPGLHISAVGSNICVYTTTGFDYTPVRVHILDACGNFINKVDYYWYFSSVIPFEGGNVDRNLNSGGSAALSLRVSNNYIQLEDASLDARVKDIQVLDAAGRLVMTHQCSDPSVQIPVEDLPSGLWIVRATTGDQVVTKKFAHLK
jgi:Metallo-peptidase family M12